MMLKLLLILFISLLFQACQVKEQVTGAKQAATNFFPGATLQTVLAGNGWKKLGDDIDVSLRFPLPITVTNSPYIDAQIGFDTQIGFDAQIELIPIIRRFYYESGTGTKNLIFRYTVTSADLDTDGISFEDNIELNGGTLTYSPGGSVVENVPTGLDIPPSEIKVDGIVPYATQTIAPTGGNYATGQQLKYRLLYSEKVFVTGAPTFSLYYLGSTTLTSKYKSGSGTANLEFSRLIAAADSDVDGFESGNLLNLSSVVTITDEAGNSVPSTIYTTTSTNILVNVAQPIITSVTPPAPATYTAGQNLDFTVLMSEAVDVTGTPAITIALNTGTVLATYLSGTGTNTLIYRYTVLTNHVDIDGITLRSPMNLRGGTIKNLAATHNAAMIYTVPATPTVYVDASTGPYVVTVARPINGTYLESVNLDFTLNFNGIVNVTGTPRLPLIIGNTTVYANYHLGGGTSSLVFRYTTTTSDLDLDGISLSGPIDLNVGTINVGTIKDLGNRPAILSYVPPDTTGILVDGTSPAIILASSAGPENLITGEYLYFSLKFNKVVNIVAPYPTMTVTVGLNPQSAIYISGTGTDTLNFRYTAQIGDDDTDGVVITSPLLTTGTIKDIRGHNAILTFTDFNTGYNIDGVSSTVSSFVLPTAPPANGYKIGDTLDFEVQWSEATFITGSPRLVLQVGSTTLYASYLSSGSTVMSSIFRYTVLAGHLDSDGITTTGLELNGGQLKDASGNNADYSIAISLLNAPNAYEIDGVVPFATITSSPANIIHKSGSTLVFNLQWNEDVTIVGTPALNLMIGSTTVTTTFLQTGTNTASFSYIVLPGQMDTNGIGLVSGISLVGGSTIKDAAGNNSYLHINVPDLTNVRIDAIVPTLIGISGPANGTYKLGETIDFVATWSEPVNVTGTPGITLTFMTGAVLQAVFVAPTSSPSTTSTFRYTVTNIDGDSDGIGMAASISLNGGTIRDVATNDASPIPFTPPTLTGVLVDGVTGTIISWTFPPSDTYAIGDNLDFTVTWSKVVTITKPIGSDACLGIYTNGFHTACYISGSGTNTLLFRYVVTSGEFSDPTDGLYVWGTVILSGTFPNNFTIKDPAPYDVYLTFPGSSGWNNDPTVIVDGVPPLVSSSTSTNITDVSKPNYFKSGHTIEYNITFDTPVVIDTALGTPRLTLNIGGATRYADFNLAATTAADPTSLNKSKRFRCILDAGDVLLDLDGIGVTTSIDMNGGSIRDVSGNDFVATFTFGTAGEKDYVYYNATLARYHVSDASDYSAATCNLTDLCVTAVTDITGNGHNLNTTSPGPQILSGVNGFGTNLTKVMKFDNASFLKTTTHMKAKYVIFVMKTVINPSFSAGSSTHTLLHRRTSSVYGTFTPAVQFTSTSSVKSILLNPIQKMKINNAAFPASATSIETGPTLWAANTKYIMAFELNAANWFYSATRIGDNNFDGQIAEIIFLSASPAITETGHVDKMIQQLNTIYGVY